MKTNEVDEVILFHKVKNEMPASAATAPYLGKIEPRGTLDEETFIAEMREDGCTESTETIRRILRGADAVQARRIGEKGNKVQTGAELMMPHLTGTLPTPDAKPGDDNELTVRIDPDDGLRNALSDLTPKENREDLSKLGGVRIYSVKSEGLDWSVLKGTQPFQIAGIGFRPTATATVEVKVVSRKTGDAATATATCEDNQRITAQLGSVLAKGDYKVVVTVTDEGGLSGNTEASYNVKMLAAPQPPAPPEPIAESSDGAVKVYAVEDDAGASTPAGLLSPHGTLFVKGTGVTLQEGSSGPGIERDVECDLDASHGMRPGISIEQTADGISVEFGSESGTMKNGEYPDAKLILRYHKDDAGGSPELIEVPVGIKVTMGQEDWPE